jgi:protein-disulfide isomerase
MSTREQQKEQARAEREARERAAARAERKRRLLLQLGAVVAVAAVVIGGLILLSQGSKDKPNASSGAAVAVAGVADARAMLQGIPQSGTRLGDPKAPVVLTEFADLQCPFCRDYAVNVLPQIIERYVRTGRLRLELRLRRFIGPDSDVAGRAAQAAATRDRMWNFIDLFYRNQGQENSGYVDDAFLSRIATAAGVPASLVVKGNTTAAALEKPMEMAESEAQAAGLESTPAFLIGPVAGEGNALDIQRLDIGAFVKAIEPELKR